MEVDAREPSNVFAVVSVQFRTPHELVPGEGRLEDHRIVLPARARPLPIPDVAAAVLPEPILLRYPIGALPTGGYVAVFEMNDFPYATSGFMVGEAEPPIPAEVKMEIDTEDPSAGPRPGEDPVPIPTCHRRSRPAPGWAPIFARGERPPGARGRIPGGSGGHISRTRIPTGRSRDGRILRGICDERIPVC